MSCVCVSLTAGSTASGTMETDVTYSRRLDLRQHKAMSEFIPLVEAREATERTRRPLARRSLSCRQQPWPGSGSETDPDDELLEWPPDGATGIRRTRPRSLCRQRRLPASRSAEQTLLQTEVPRSKEHKAPPSPSLLMRVKEHFHNRVMLPQPAVMADLRQRAVEAFEASLSEREQSERVVCRATDCADGDAKRAAYRRRSISDDTYNRPTRTAPAAAAAQSANRLTDDGVVCSTVDLLSIFRCATGSTGTPDIFTRTSSAATDFSAAASSSECESGADGLSFVSYNTATTSRDVEWPASLHATDQTDAAQSAVPDIEYDEYGQTWDVYGAEYDPEVLGTAIEKHLERIVRHQQRSGNDESGLDNGPQSPRQPPAKESRRQDVGFLLRMLRCLIPARRQQAR